MQTGTSDSPVRRIAENAVMVVIAVHVFILFTIGALVIFRDFLPKGGAEFVQRLCQ